MLTDVADWVQDAAKEQLRRKRKRQETKGFFERGGRAGWRYKFWESYEAAQGWIVVTIIGKTNHAANVGCSYDNTFHLVEFKERLTNMYRCCNRIECSFLKYYYRVAFGYQAWTL